MNNSIYSYDIFDTCLVRACGEPSHVWDILAHKILGESADFAQIADFVLIRRSAEGKAREELISHEKEDVTIEDIYTYCDFSSLTDISKHDIMEEEMAVEEKMLIPVYSVLTSYIKRGSVLLSLVICTYPNPLSSIFLLPQVSFMKKTIFISAAM